MHDAIEVDRRQFLSLAGVAIAGARTGLASVGGAQTPMTRAFEVKQVNAGVLSVGYAELGSPRGRAVLLLHGWPHDIHSYENVAPRLASAGYRVIVPYLRGYGTTRFPPALVAVHAANRALLRRVASASPRSIQ